MSSSVESQWAFKEWAAVCEAIARGKQTVLLRKGGIHEQGGEFRPEHDAFWLAPTRFHQDAEEIREPYQNLIEAAAQRTPPAGKIAFSEFVVVSEITYASTLDELDRFSEDHILSQTTVEKRFQYREPGLYLLRVEAHRLDEPLMIEEPDGYAGCKTWVELPQRLQSSNAQRVE